MPEENTYTEEEEESYSSPTLDEGETMDEEELLEIIRGKLTDAKDFVDSWLSPNRAKAQEYYLTK